MATFSQVFAAVAGGKSCQKVVLEGGVSSARARIVNLEETFCKAIPVEDWTSDWPVMPSDTTVYYVDGTQSDFSHAVLRWKDLGRADEYTDTTPSMLKAIGGTNCTSLGIYAFCNCRNFTTASFPNCLSLGSAAFADCEKLVKVSFPKCSTIEQFTFYSCISLSSVRFKECVTIGSSAFESCVNLRTADFPKCKIVKTVAFYSCHRLTTASFPSCSNIDGGYNFINCFNLLSLYLMGSSVCRLGGRNAFDSTPIAGYTTSTGGAYGSIFVPQSLLTSYKNATNWTYFSSRIVGI